MSFTPRQWQIIQNQIKANIAAKTELSGLTSESQAAHWQLWTFIMALGSNLDEQAMTVFFDEIETIIAQGAPQTPPWIQARILEFQYNTATPYLVAVNNNIVSYPVIVLADRIISNCAVVPNNAGAINVKVTTGNPAGTLNADQLTALKSYLTNFLAPNQVVNLISVAADQLWVKGTVFYNGQLNASIQDSVISALNAYITKFSTSQSAGGSFNGLVKVSDIEKIILAIPGVTDWVAEQVTVTPVVGSVTNLVLAGTQVFRSYGTYSGYVANDSTNPFSTQLTFTPANN